MTEKKHKFDAGFLRVNEKMQRRHVSMQAFDLASALENRGIKLGGNDI